MKKISTNITSSNNFVCFSASLSVDPYLDPGQPKMSVKKYRQNECEGDRYSNVKRHKQTQTE